MSCNFRSSTLKKEFLMLIHLPQLDWRATSVSFNKLLILCFLLPSIFDSFPLDLLDELSISTKNIFKLIYCPGK